ncbi:mammalian cell entry protein [Mycobacterium uberis]|uniref:Mammalian cell entry protein n=1 Tax=Mycobacterium uberis TaxID=2162698 RepID=A0A3E1HI79_9MYCO|nr:mammalian cell entry protein [Mycobacterium uberis]
MTSRVAEQPSTTPRVRRRAFRAAGPAKGQPGAITTVQAGGAADRLKLVQTIMSERPVVPTGRVKSSPRRPAHRVRVGWIALTGALLAIAALAGCLTALVVQHQHAEVEQARHHRFVDTATQTVVNMFSYRPENIDESVNRFVNGTSGPLHGMLSSNNNVDNLKSLFRSTNAASEAVVNGAALEGVDPVTGNASVLVSVRVTVADIDGVNKPSMPYRLRVIVHEDDDGRMTGYDLKYPDGGN